MFPKTTLKGIYSSRIMRDSRAVVLGGQSQYRKGMSMKLESLKSRLVRKWYHSLLLTLHCQ